MHLETWRRLNGLTKRRLGELLGVPPHLAKKHAQKWCSHTHIPNRLMIARIEQLTRGAVTWRDFPMQSGYARREADNRARAVEDQGEAAP